MTRQLPAPVERGGAAAPKAPEAIVYLASAEDADAGRCSVAGLPVAFRVAMTALRAGCSRVRLPEAYRGTDVERAVARSPRARARVAWANDAVGAPDAPAILLPATVIAAAPAVRALLDATPVAVLGASPADAPVVLADAALLAEAGTGSGTPAGDAIRCAVAARRPRPVRARWCVRAADAAGRRDAEQHLYADLGSVIDTRLDRLIHRPPSRYLTRVAMALRMSANLVTLLSLCVGLLAVSCMAMGTVTGGLLAIALYYASTVLDHSDGEVARLTYSESRVGEWLDVAVDNVTHTFMALAMGMTAEHVAGSGRRLAVLMAIGFGMSALAAKTSPPGDRAPQVLARLGNRDGFYLLLVAFVALLAFAPAALPGLLVVATLGAHAYWIGHLAVRLRGWGARAVEDRA